MARPWNPEFKHSDRERWICIYPAYINARKTRAEGRKIVRTRAVDNPRYEEIKEVLVHAGLTLGVENKVYPRERDCFDMKSRGRIRVQLRHDDGTAMYERFPDRLSILSYLGETIPKLKSRQGGGASAGASAAPSSGAGGAGAGASASGGGAGAPGTANKKKNKRRK